ncbi:MAG: CAAD domain-containing protein [Elainellaceae cyanobacterium]
MEPDVKQTTPGASNADVNTDVSVESSAQSVGSTPAATAYSAQSSDTAGDLPPSAETTETKEQWQKIGAQTSTFLSELPSYISEFFGQYRRPILTIGLILGTILAIKISLAILDAINDVPLLAPTFELIGISYAIWFVYRYLLKASDRAELSEDFSALKQQVLGGKDRLLDRFSSDEKLGS